MSTVITIPALGDNFIYLCQYDRSHAFVVDPCDSPAVMRVLNKHGLSLTTIFATHHHWDHIAGAADLKNETRCHVIGGDRKRTPGIDRVVADGQVLAVGDATIRVIATPGHTRSSVCYYMQPANQNEAGMLWTGDTLFVGGCGRLLECSPESMWHSLMKLASLPDDTLIYPGHDYTLENYEFALSIEPHNQPVKRRLQEVTQAQKAGDQTVPSTILQEKTTNPFLHADTSPIKAALNMPRAPAVQTFAELRRRKDTF